MGYVSEESPVISVGRCADIGGFSCAPVFSYLALLCELAPTSVLEGSSGLRPLVCPTQHPEDKTGQFQWFPLEEQGNFFFKSLEQTFPCSYWALLG